MAATDMNFSTDSSIEEELEHIKQMRSMFMDSMEGKIWIADDFDAPLDEMKEYM